MAKPKHSLLASHGTEGARAAEKLSYSYCGPGTTLHHLIVVPDLWKGMQGDDWLNNAWTRDAFGRHVEGQLEADAREQLRGEHEAERSRQMHGVNSMDSAADRRRSSWTPFAQKVASSGPSSVIWPS